MGHPVSNEVSLLQRDDALGGKLDSEPCLKMRKNGVKSLVKLQKLVFLSS